MEKQLFRDRQAGRVVRVDREIEGDGGGRERESVCVRALNLCCQYIMYV